MSICQNRLQVSPRAPQSSGIQRFTISWCTVPSFTESAKSLAQACITESSQIVANFCWHKELISQRKTSFKIWEITTISYNLFSKETLCNFNFKSFDRFDFQFTLETTKVYQKLTQSKGDSVIDKFWINTVLFYLFWHIEDICRKQLFSATKNVFVYLCHLAGTS